MTDSLAKAEFKIVSSLVSRLSKNCVACHLTCREENLSVQ